MASNLGRIVAHAGHPAIQPGSQMPLHLHLLLLHPRTQLLTGYMCVHLETRVHPCTSIAGSSAGHTTAVV